MPKVTLYQFKNDNISIEIQAYFKEDDVVIEGYDIGKNVKGVLGRQ